MLAVITFMIFTILVAYISYHKTKGEARNTPDGYFLGGIDSFEAHLLDKCWYKAKSTGFAFGFKGRKS